MQEVDLYNIEELGEELLSSLESKKAIAIISTTPDKFIIESFKKMSTAKLEDIRKKFKQKYVGAIEGAYKDGKIYVINGNKRVKVCQEKGIERLICYTWFGLGSEEMAEIALTKDNAQSRSEGNFAAKICAEDLEALEIREIVNRQGFSLGIKGFGFKKNMTIHAISTLEKIHAHKENLLETILWVIKNTWKENTQKMLTSDIMLGLMYYFIVSPENVKEFPSRLQGVTREEYYEKVKALKKVFPMGYEAEKEAFAYFYNRATK